MATLTVFFEGPWWVGVLEVEDEDGLRAHRFVFGPEPGWPAIQELVLERWSALRAQPAVAVAVPKRVPPKRAARDMAGRARTGRPSTKAQASLAASTALGKQERKATGKARREAKEAHKRQVAKRKALAKRRGR